MFSFERLGSLQHPCLDMEDGEEFDVKWIALRLRKNALTCLDLS